jgi:hypothetical protein
MFPSRWLAESSFFAREMLKPSCKSWCQQWRMMAKYCWFSYAFDWDFVYLLMFFAWKWICSCFFVFLLFYTDLWLKWTRPSHTTTLKASFHLYCLHYCQFTTEIIASPIAAYFARFFRILRKRRRIFRVFNLCINPWHTSTSRFILLLWLIVIFTHVN